MGSPGLTDALLEREGRCQRAADFHQALGAAVEEVEETVPETHGSQGVEEVVVINVVESFLLIEVDHG